MSSSVGDSLAWLQANCVSVIANINEHKAYYNTVAQHISEQNEKVAISGFDGEALAECIRSDQLCEVQVYPDTPIGFFVFRHHNIGAAIEMACAAIKAERQGAADKGRGRR